MLNLLLTIIRHNGHHFRVVMITVEFGIDSGTPSCAFTDSTALSMKISTEPTDNDEVALMNEDSIGVSSLIQHSQLFPFLCHCAECGNCIGRSIIARPRVTAKNIESFSYCDDRISYYIWALTEYTSSTVSNSRNEFLVTIPFRKDNQIRLTKCLKATTARFYCALVRSYPQQLDILK